MTELPKTALDAGFYPCISPEGGPSCAPAYATPDGRSKGEPVSAGLSPAGAYPATARLNGAAAALSETPADYARSGFSVEAAFPLSASDPESEGRLKAFLQGAAAVGVTGLLLSAAGEESAPAEGEPDYDCVPIFEEAGI